MAYKFSLGKYKHSGSLVSADSLTVSSGAVDLPSGTINTHEIADAAVTNGKIAAAAVQSGSIQAAAIVDGHIASATITNAKLANTGSVLGSTAVVLGSTVTTIAGLAALSASAISGGVVIGDGAGMTNLSASQLNNFTADVRRQVSVTDTTELDFSYVDGAVSAEIKSGSIQNAKLANSTISGKALGTSLDSLSNAANSGLSAFTYDGSGPVSISLSASLAGSGLGYAAGVLSIAPDGAIKVVADGLYISSSLAGQGLGFVSGTAADSVGSLNVQTTGALSVFTDFVGINDSLAGQGLGAVTGSGGVVSSLNVNRAGAIAILGGDAVAITSSIAGTGLSFATGGLADAVTTLSVAYGSAAGTAAQGNVAVTASAGNGLTGGGSYLLGAGANLDFAVGAGNGIEVAADSVAVKLSGGLSNEGLIVNTNGLDLKYTIAGNRTFSNDLTVQGNLYVNGGTFSASVGTLLVEDANITIADGAPALSASQGFTIGAGLATFQVGDGSSTNSAFVSSLELKASKFIGAVEGAVAESVETLSGSATAAASVVLCDAASAGFTVTLPSAVGKSGQFIKVKKVDSTENAVVIDANGSQTIDGELTVTIDSPYAGLMLVSNGSNWFIF